ncbi:MAG: hypothetical protein ABRQ38_09800 [Candidatus Eremiobacterota bacterium]
MRFSNRYVSSKKDNLDASIIAQLAFGELQSKVPEVTGKPVLCHSCGAAVTDPSVIKDNPPLGLHFICQFCNNLNKIDELQFNSIKAIEKGVIEYLDEIQKNMAVKDRIVACIDISGSMNGDSLECVKKSLIETLKDISVNSPDSTFALITFTDWVSLYNADGNECIKLSENNLYDENNIFQTLQNLHFKFETVKDSYDRWIKLISRLTAMSRTALGPAVFSAFSLLRGGGRIILLTDGLANVGLGSLISYSPGGRKGDFYRDFGQRCRDAGVMVEIVGVVTSEYSSLELETIGDMARLTGGDIYLVDKKELSTTFNALSQADFIGRNVKVRIFVPSSMALRDASGDVHFHREKMSLDAKVGYVNPDRKMCVALNVTEDLKANEDLTVQTQVEYTGTDGKKRIRIYNEKLHVTEKEEDIVENFESEVSDEFYIQKAAEQGRRGHDVTGIKILKDYAEKLQTYNTIAGNQKRETLKKSTELISRELEDINRLSQEKSKDARFSKYQARVSFGSTSELRQESRKMRKTVALSELEPYKP